MPKNVAANIQSKYLNQRQLSALNRFGDLMLPRHGEYPGFAELGCIQHIDILVEHAPKDDLATLKLFLSVFSIKPTFAYRIILWSMRTSGHWPEPIATLLRTMDMALRGMIVSLYYSGLKSDSYPGKTPLELIGYDINIVR